MDFNGRIRKLINCKKQIKLKNKNITLISSDCNGGVILHDLNLPFNSPFINLWIKPNEYIKLLENLEYYMQLNLVFVKEKGIDYPIGVLKDIRIYFQHYDSEERALELWNKRKKRMNYDNLYILFTNRNGCTNEDLQRFDKLPYRNKKVFVHKKMPNIKSSVYIPGFENQDCVGICIDYINNYSGKRYFDYFDYVSWFNEEF